MQNNRRSHNDHQVVNKIVNNPKTITTVPGVPNSLQALYNERIMR